MQFIHHKHYIPWFFSGNGIVSLSLLSRFRISRISLWKQVNTDSAELLIAGWIILSSQQERNAAHAASIETSVRMSAVGVPLYVFDIGSHQPLLLQKVDGGGRPFLQDGDVGAFIHPEVHPRLRVRPFRSQQRQQTTHTPSLSLTKLCFDLILIWTLLF